MASPTVVVALANGASVTVRFSAAIRRINGATAWENGFTLTKNAAPVTISSAEPIPGGIKFTCTTTFIAGDAVLVSYNGTNLADNLTGVDLVTVFSNTTATVVGYMNTSEIILQPLTIRGTSATAYVANRLSVQDQAVVSSLGPITFTISGTFGTEVVAKTYQIWSGDQASYTFTEATTEASFAAANLFSTELVAAIATGLDKLRRTNAALTFTTTLYTV